MCSDFCFCLIIERKKKIHQRKSVKKIFNIRKRSDQEANWFNRRKERGKGIFYNKSCSDQEANWFNRRKEEGRENLGRSISKLRACTKKKLYSVAIVYLMDLDGTLCCQGQIKKTDSHFTPRIPKAFEHFKSKTRRSRRQIWKPLLQVY